MGLSFIRKEVLGLNGVLIAAGSITLSCMLGSAAGCGLRHISERVYGRITAVAAGVMLCAAVHGLLLPSMQQQGTVGAVAGLVLGALLLCGMNRAAEHRMTGQGRAHGHVGGLMFVCAIAIHHFPEGLAAGVSFGTGDGSETAAVCIAIALQNIPEAMMIMPAMLPFGRGKSICAAAASWGMELLGLLMGYLAVQMTTRLLPIMLALAAGAMLYVIFQNMLPDVYKDSQEKAAFSVLLGYCGMLLLTELAEKLLS